MYMKKFKVSLPLIFMMSLVALTSCDKDRQAQESPKCVESVKPDCVCAEIYQPVCGCNNVTYGNSCSAECAGITEYKNGECPK